MKSKMSNVSLVSSVLVVLISIVLIFNFARSLTQSGGLTFEAIFQYISATPTIPLIPLNSLTITANWGIFNFVRDFINIFTGILTISTWFAINMMNALLFIFRFVTLMFV